MHSGRGSSAGQWFCNHRIDDLNFVTGLSNVINFPLSMCDVPLVLVSADLGGGYSTSGHSSMALGKELVRDIVSMEKGNEK